jgi:hypothetical protein
MCEVLNVRRVGRSQLPDRVYVRRPSKWGNLLSPAATARATTSSRNIALGSYGSTALMAALHELHNKELVCWCLC